MTTHRDADRILRAWLDLMPDEAPGPHGRRRPPGRRDDAADAATRPPRPEEVSFHEPLLAHRRRRRAGGRRCRRRPVRRRRPEHEPAPTPPAVAATPVAVSIDRRRRHRADAKAPSSLVGTWFGPGRDVPGIVAGSGSRLTGHGHGCRVRARPNDQGRPAPLGGGRRRAPATRSTVTSGLGSCAATDTGTYQWSLSASGTVLDDHQRAATRARSAPQRSRAPGGRPRARSGRRASETSRPATYASQFFRPDHNQASEWAPLFGGIGYTVPGGMGELGRLAEPVRYVTPSTSYADEDSSGGGPIGVVHEVAVYAREGSAPGRILRRRQSTRRSDRRSPTLERWIAGLHRCRHDGRGADHDRRPQGPNARPASRSHRRPRRAPARPGRPSSCWPSWRRQATTRTDVASSRVSACA